jgi:hypothetical protein
MRRQSGTPVTGRIRLRFYDAALSNDATSWNDVTLSTTDWTEVKVTGTKSGAGDPGLTPDIYCKVEVLVAGSNGTAVDVLFDRVYFYEGGAKGRPSNYPRPLTSQVASARSVQTWTEAGYEAAEAFQVVWAGSQQDQHDNEYGRGDYALHSAVLDMVPLS